MDWSPQQSRALQLVEQWKKRRDKPYFALAGYAGTGKTTLAKHFAEHSTGKVLFAAYTGKAAHVLRKSGIKDVSTIHQLIYLPRNKCELRFAELKRELAELKQETPLAPKVIAKVEKEISQELKNLQRPEFTLNEDSPLRHASLLIVDEYSMIDEMTGADLLYFGCPVLALGDPGQLPPVRGRQFFSAKPDYQLTEIHRHAADNPIIRMSMEVRSGKPLTVGSYGKNQVLRMRRISEADLNAMMLGADQILVGMNTTRCQYNAQMRLLLGRTEVLPEVSDKLVCLRNDHNTPLLNGQTWTVIGTYPRNSHFLQLSLLSEDGVKYSTTVHPDYFDGNPEKLTPSHRKLAHEFDFGYALTTHKSQGSQWNEVVLLDEWFGADRKAWLYTGITRAVEKITVIIRA